MSKLKSDNMVDTDTDTDTDIIIDTDSGKFLEKNPLPLIFVQSLLLPYPKSWEELVTNNKSLVAISAVQSAGKNKLLDLNVLKIIREYWITPPKWSTCNCFSQNPIKSCKTSFFGCEFDWYDCNYNYGKTINVTIPQCGDISPTPMYLTIDWTAVKNQVALKKKKRREKRKRRGTKKKRGTRRNHGTKRKK